MLMICGVESGTVDPEEGLDAETTAWVEEMDRRGTRIAGDRLRPTRDATTVRMRDGEVLVSDAPSPKRRSRCSATT